MRNKAAPSSALDAEKQTALSGRAWDLMQEVIEKGQVTLRPLTGATDEASTKVVTLKDRHVLSAVVWLAGLTAKKKTSRTTLRTLADEVDLQESR